MSAVRKGVIVETVACPDCDLLQHIPRIPAGGKVRCARCGETLFIERANALSRTLALTVAAAVAFIIANTMPLSTTSTIKTGAGGGNRTLTGLRPTDFLTSYGFRRRL